VRGLARESRQRKKMWYINVQLKISQERKGGFNSRQTREDLHQLHQSCSYRLIACTLTPSKGSQRNSPTDHPTAGKLPKKLKTQNHI